jgi:hypothetical protein
MADGFFERVLWAPVKLLAELVVDVVGTTACI